MRKRGVFLLFILFILIVLTVTIAQAYFLEDFITGAAARRLLGGNESTPNCITNTDCPRGEYCSGRRCTAVEGFCESTTDCATGEICLRNEQLCEKELQ